MASRLAVENMQALLQQYIKTETPAPVDLFLENALDMMDISVTQAIGRQKGGTTVVAVYIVDGRLYWVSAGDSRLYAYRNGEMVQVTRDHNYFLRLNEELKSGEITQEYYRAEAEKGEHLISFAGVGGISVFDLSREPVGLLEGDILLLTTDGLYKALPKELIQHVLRSRNPLSVKADKLLSQIQVLKKNIVLDNTTFILIQIHE